MDDDAVIAAEHGALLEPNASDRNFSAASASAYRRKGKMFGDWSATDYSFTKVSQLAYRSSSPWTAPKNVDWISFVMGPRPFDPTTRSSISRIGQTSAAVPVKKASSAKYRSVRAMFRSWT